MMLLQNSLYAGVLIAAVIALRPLLRRAPARLSVCLWGAALLRLLLPVRVPSPLSIYNWLPWPRGNGLDPAAVEITVTFSGSNTAAGLSQAAAYSTNQGFMSWEAGMVLLWAAGALLCAGTLLKLLLCTRRALCTALPLPENEGLQRLCPGVRLYSCERIATPLNCGVLRPRILLPSGMQDGDQELLGHALAHEMAHIRGRHNLLKAAGLLALCLHWFNPMVYVLLFLMERDLERACDESVLRRLGSGRRADYARSLLRFAGVPGPLRPLCSAFGGNPVEERVRGIMGFGRCSKSKTALYTALCFLLCALLISSPVMAGGSSDSSAAEEIYLVRGEKFMESETASGGQSFVAERMDDAGGVDQSANGQEDSPVGYWVKARFENPLLSAMSSFLGIGVISVTEAAGESDVTEEESWQKVSGSVETADEESTVETAAVEDSIVMERT